MTHLVHPASLHSLTHKTLIEMGKRVQAHKWCQKQFGRAWEPFKNPEGRWTMVWGGHNGSATNQTNFDKYQVCFADEQDLLMFETTLGSSLAVDQ